ncbi:chitin synthase [Beauveria bassiana ARSEF 2860]|uniref:Chitin synthase n=1 Tax=Beauveria bassiana (strain ARSEF 2860) TaxID=655819 RepID=J4VT90_BEAB2|nr:chitin synthase [Beauveria bassiana ARSEF 2860]EJP61760.1 chitin synthase [Beauveria bassiana ARSEF 2860]
MSASPPASAASVLPPSQPCFPPFSVPSDDPVNDELVDIQSSDVMFLETLKMKIDRKNGNKCVVTFKVEISNKLCVMKVYKHTGYWDQFRTEECAYRLLQDRGFCERGVVPKFYGIIDRIEDVNLWPDLYQFEDDTTPPSALIIEYIPDANKIDLDNFTQDNMDRLCAILAEFHNIGLLHGDPYPRNMMVVQGTPRDRVFWLDFDSSSIEDRTVHDEHAEMLFRQESEEMACIAKAYSADAKTGKPTTAVRPTQGFLAKLPSNQAGLSDPGALIIAHSLGGLITLHAVEARPELFFGVLYADVPH